MLQVRDLRYEIGDRQLLSGVDWMIQPGKRVALIGPNGAGKTTLLRILHGDIQDYYGSIIKPKDYRIGYLPQEEIAASSGSVLHAVVKYHEAFAIEQQLAALHATLDGPHNSHETLLKQVGELEHRYDALDGYHLEVNAKTILSGLGFTDEEIERPLSEFSGGWRMRAYLARLLLQKPDLLLLDEPTNHLDIPSLEWLESYLLNSSQSIIIVSHDRFFVDRLSQAIYELDRGKLEYYAGNYHFYEQEKAQRTELLWKQWEEQKDERERQERFINRFRYKATKAKQVQSRIKMLEKMETVDMPPPPPPRLHFQIKVDTPSYKDVLHIKSVSFRYDQDWVLEALNLSVYRSEKICLVGVNGAGKTTLTRLIAGELTPQFGSVTIGERVSIGYYAQHQVDALNLDATVYDEVLSSAAESQRLRVRDVLGMFQFRGDDIYKKVGVLSGGEKARVSLTKILLSPVNFLIMDEPTNHLDVMSKEALEHALMNYDGTLILISHDRYFLDKIVSRVVELKNHRLTQYPGNYSEYLEQRDRAAQQTEVSSAPMNGAAAQSAEMETLPADSGRKSKEQKRQEAEARQAISKERNRLTKIITALETHIATYESRKSELDIQMSLPETYNNGDLVQTLQKEYAGLKQDLEDAYRRWEEAQIEIEALIQQLA